MKRSVVPQHGCLPARNMRRLWEWAGRSGKAFQELHRLRQWIIFRQTRRTRERTIFRLEDNREKNQRELKVVKFCLCDKIGG